MTDQFINELDQTTKVYRTDLMVLERDPNGTPKTYNIPYEYILNGGWIEVADAWTYNSATGINVPSGATSIYRKGWGIRYKQGGSFKYGYIINVASTLLTVHGGTDYSVLNAAITDVAYSPNPNNAFGFPAFFNQAIVINGAAGSAGTYAETVNIEGRFSIDGNRLFLTCSKRVTNKGSWTGNVQIILPVAPNSIYSGVMQYPPCWWANGGLTNAPKAMLRLVNSTTATFLDAVNSSFFDWTELAANDWLMLDISYWI